MGILKQMFCGHKWKGYAKREYRWEKKEVVEGTEGWAVPDFKVQLYSETVEVIVCEKCGKIKKIRY